MSRLRIGKLTEDETAQEEGAAVTVTIEVIVMTEAVAAVETIAGAAVEIGIDATRVAEADETGQLVG